MIEVDDLIAAGKSIESDDCRQTFYLLVLEGHDLDEARRLSTVSRADPMHSNSSQRGPLDSAARRPISIAFLCEPEQTPSGQWLGTFDHLHPYTLDSRSVEERIEDAERTERIALLLDQLPDVEREVIARIYGFDGREVQTYPQIAADLNRSRNSIAQYGWQARRRLKKLMEAS